MYQKLLQVKKEFLDTSNISELLIKHLLVTVGYAIFFLIFYALSKNFFTHQGWSNWYLPNGIRIVAMLVLPIRFWPTLLFTELFCNRFITVYYGSFSLTPMLQVLTKVSVIYTLYGLVLLPAKLFYKTIKLNHVKYCIALLIGIIGQSTIAATNLTFFVRFYSNIPIERKIEIWLSFINGGIIGGLLIAPLLLGLLQLIKENRYWPSIPAAISLTAYAILLTLVYAYLRIKPESLYVIVALALIPIMLFAHNFGWTGSLFATTLTNLFLAASVYGHSGTLTMQQIQLFVIILNVSALLFGAVISNQKALTRSLSQSNDRLQKLASHNQQLASKFVDVQEHERKVLSQELHDDIGQIVTALKTDLKVMSATATDPLVKEQIPRLLKSTSSIYETVYRLMHRLRPRLLDEHGLYNALTSGELVSNLKHAGISYNHNITGDINTLPQNIQIAIFRICQEAFTNTIKHSAASQCNLEVMYDKSTIRLAITDNGKCDTPKSNSTNGGFGITGIQDRVNALNGKFDFFVSNGGATLFISLPT